MEEETGKSQVEVIGVDQLASLKLPKIIDNKLFAFVRVNKTLNGTTYFAANCLLCKGGKEILGDNKSSGNFVKHLRATHQSDYNAYQKRKQENSQADDTQPSMKKFCQVLSSTSGKQKKADQLILNYVVNSMRPLSTVDDPNFRILVQGLSGDPKMEIMSRKTLQNRINNMFDDLVLDIKSRIRSVDYLCLTADCWSSYSRAFLGVTCHWISQDFKRESAVLACKRFKGTHSYDRIAAKLTEIMAAFGIQNEQVVAVVTDNGSNFCKAFKEYGFEFEDGNGEDAGQVEENEDALSEDSSDEKEPLIEQDCQATLEARDKSFVLPPHFRCTSHTLSLVATKDGLDVKDKRLYNSTLGKCTKLWNISWSPKSAEKIKDICGISLKRPVPTRWNSMYDSMKCLLAVEKYLDSVCEELKVTKFQPKEIDFLREFVKMSDPVAQALDRMQGEKGLFFGSLVPTLVSAKTMLIKSKEEAQLCKGFVTAHLQGIEKRFGDIMSIDPKNPSDYIFAAMTNPEFKLRWIPAELHEELKLQFTMKAKLFCKDIANTNSGVAEEEFDPFYQFKDVKIPPKLSDSLGLECILYFNDNSKNISMLSQYPTVQKMFRRFNTLLPSSAPVERVFSYAGMILSPKRSSLKDANFEKLVVLKCNGVFSQNAL